MSESLKANPGLMEKQSRRFRDYNLRVKKGRTWEEIYGTEKANELRGRLQEMMRGKSNPNYGNGILSGENNPNWRGGISRLPYPFDFDKDLKRAIRERDGNRCIVCDIDSEEHYQGSGYNLSIHHIDYNKMNCAPSNLVTLCKSCHSKTNHARPFFQELFTEYSMRVMP